MRTQLACLVLLLLVVCAAAAVPANPKSPPAQSQPEAATIDNKKIRVLILDGFSNHNWQLNTKLLRSLLTASGLFDVSVSTCPPASSPDWAAWRPDFSKTDVILQTCNDISQRPAPRWPDPVKADFAAFVKKGGGVFMNHSANNAFPDWPEYNDIIGLGWRPASYGTAFQMDADGKITKLPPGQGVNTTHATRAEVLVHNLPTDNPIHKDFPNAWKSPLLEVYVCARGPANNVQVLSYGQDPRNKQFWPIEWTVTYGEGRVYASSMGHVWSDESEEKQPVDLLAIDEQIILQRALQWLAKRPVTVAIPLNFPTAEKTSLSPNIPLPK